jgi:hypothetical protein
MQTSMNMVPAALVWLDRRHALVARTYDQGTLVTEIDRDLDAESEFLLRVAREAAECDRLVVMGPDASRLAFEREYVALYQRPDRLIDAGMEIEPGARELTDRLRFLASAGSA